MRRSIRTRWVVVTLVLVLSAVGVTAVLAANQAARNTEEAVEEALASRDFVFEQLVTYRDVVGGWDGVQTLVDQLSDETETRVAVTDDRGRVLGDSSSSDDDESLPAVPVGFVESGLSESAYEVPDDPEVALTLLEPFLGCLERGDVPFIADLWVQVESSPAARACVAEHVFELRLAGGPLVVQLTTEVEALESLGEDLAECFDQVGVEYEFHEDGVGPAFPDPVDPFDPAVERAIALCFDTIEEIQSSGELVGLADGAVVYMDINGADPLAVAADPFDPTVVVTVALVGFGAAVAAWFAASRLVRPIGSLTAAVRDMGAGDLDRRVNLARDDELGDLGRAFDQMADDIAENDRQRRRLTSDVAHELRTPLANIRGYLEGAQDGVVDLDRALVDTVHEEALHLQHLVDDLQTLSLVESGRLRIEPGPMEMGPLVSSLVAAHTARANEAGVDLTLDVDHDPTVAADPARVRQILANLVENALRHTPAGGSVVVSISQRDGHGTASVADTGPGIAEDDLRRIFDRFYRTDAARTRDQGGSGLGLAISNELAVAMGGGLSAESVVGEGSIFTLSLPLAP